MGRKGQSTPLVAEIRKLRNAAQKKSRRLDRVYGMDVRDYIPQPKIPVLEMTGSQRLAYKRQLERFNSRKTRFVKSESGRGVPRELVVERDRLMKRLEKMDAKRFSSYANEPFDPGNVTAAQQHGMRNPLDRVYDMRLKVIPEERALRAQIKKLKHAGTKGFVRERIRRDKASMVKAALSTGDISIVEDVADLSTSEIEELLSRTDWASWIYDSQVEYGTGESDKRNNRLRYLLDDLKDRRKK